MDLWLRTQDRHQLIKVDSIGLTYDNGKASRIVCYENSRTWVVGFYEKERAMEILDEIQNILFDKPIKISPLQEQQEKEYENIKNAIKYGINIPVIQDASVEYIDLNCIVYEMPKE